MKEELLNFEKQSRNLEPESSHRFLALEAIQRYTEDFLQDIDTRDTYIGHEPDYSILTNNITFKEQTALEQILHEINQYVDVPGINPASGGHLGYIPGGGLFYSAIADYLAALTNRYAGVRFASPGAVVIEDTVLHWIANLFGFKSGWGGTLTSGGSIANLAAMATARDAIDLKAADFHKAVIYTTSYVHHCLHKSLRIIGMAEAQWREVACDEHFRMDVNALKNTIFADKEAGLIPWMLVASAGTTDVGAIDPLQELAQVAQEHKLWFHVDAAYGGFFMLTEEGRNKLVGIEQADSLVADPHKGLFIPYGTGALLVKNKSLLHKSNYYMANYMQDAVLPETELSPADLSPELSRHFRGLRIWLPLKIHGEKPFSQYLNEKLLLTKYCLEELRKQPDVEICNEPDLSIFTFRFKHPNIESDLYNEHIQNALKEDGRVFLSSTRLNGNFVLRIAILSFRTHLSTIDRALEMLYENKTRVQKELLEKQD